MTDAHLVEVFSSIQGEGLFIGCRQIFIRLAECNLACAYCDTDFRKASLYQRETAPGSGFFTDVPNPVELPQLLGLIRQWQRDLPGAHHSLSITGGEPLCQGETLAEWLPQLRQLLPLHLETNGTLPERLEPLLPHLDFISMDIKLASTCGVATPWELHRDFLHLASRLPCQVKAVVGPDTPAAEIEQAAQLVAACSAQIPLILQPQTRDDVCAVAADRLLELQALAATRHRDTRVIPQLHRYLSLP